jgi:hypothetical protein
MSLTIAEVDRGWVEFVCPAHGFLVATTPAAGVTCGECRRQAKRMLNGSALKSRDIERMQRTVQKPLQIRGSISRIAPLAAEKAENDPEPSPVSSWPPKALDAKWGSTRARVLQRDRYTCQRCNLAMQSADLDAHHIRPRGEGGDDRLWNLITLCEPCHDWVEVQDDPPLRNRAQIVGSWESEEARL